MTNLADFAQSAELRTLAAMVIDLIAIDLAHNTYRGVLATTHGRTAERLFLEGLRDNTAEAAWLLTGLGEPRDPLRQGAVALATSRHLRPAILDALADELSEYNEIRQRDGFTLEEGLEALGLGTESVDDVMTWSGLFAFFAPEIVGGAMAVFEAYSLFDGPDFDAFPPAFLDLIRNLIGSPALPDLAGMFEPVSRGLALEAVSTYVYRTPDYQLAAAQDYKPGQWSTQSRMWQATLTAEAHVTGNAPALLGVTPDPDSARDGQWVGGWHPRATFHRDVGIIQYRRPTGFPVIDDFVFGDYLHAYVPRDVFDEFVEQDGWVIGREDQGYVALWCSAPTRWHDGNRYELIADTTDAVFVVEMGREAEDGSFADFVAAVLAAEVTVGAEGVVYQSPSTGRFAVGWDGPLTVDDAPVALGDVARFDHPQTQQALGDATLTATAGGQRLVLDFEAGTRRLYDAEPAD